MLTEPTFAELASVCDGLLDSDPGALPRTANVWLHPISAHPHHTARYEARLSGGARARAAGLRVGFRRRGALLRDLHRSARGGTPSDTLAGEAAALVGAARPLALIVSHLVAASHLNDPADFYFGRLAELLHERGWDSLTLLINQTGSPAGRYAASARRGGRAARVLLPDAASIAEELAFLAAGVRDGRRLRAAAAGRHGIAAAVAAGAAGAATGPLTRRALRLHAQIGAIIRRLQPRIVIATNEGHSWERCVWLAASAVHPVPLRVGYQHSVVLKSTHALLNPIASSAGAARPDMVWTPGEVTMRMLRKSALARHCRLELYGTHKSANARAAGSASGGACLVLPEGLDAECRILFGLAIECARLLPAHRFVLRNHPAIPYERLAARYPALQNLPENVSVSTEPRLEDDIARSSSCLYRGSAAAVHAAAAGLRPIYVSRPEEPSLDPLFELAKDGWCARVGSAAELHDRLVDGVNGVAGGIRAAVIEYCQQYSLPVSAASLDRTLGHEVESWAS